MRNIKLKIEYDGTNYNGWQKQKNGTTIQETIEEAIKKITNEKCVLLGSGRTDSGVHAYEQVANFKTSSRLSLKKFQMGLNSFLPDDITILDVKEMKINFHSQFDSKSKIYEYTILNRSYPSAHLRNSAWFVNYSLDVDAMSKASDHLLGTHDFKIFSHADSTVKSTVRTIFKVKLKKKGNLIRFEIESDGFLKRMVRMIVGTLIQVGKRKISPDDFKNIIKTGKKSKFIFSAPPHGLFLKKVKYR